LKELEQETTELKRLVSELSLDKLVLKDIASLPRSFNGPPSRCLLFDFGIEVEQKLPLSHENLWTTGQPVSRKDGNGLEIFCFRDYSGPVGKIGIKKHGRDGHAYRIEDVTNGLRRQFFYL
jgi:hypothetical protein